MNKKITVAILLSAMLLIMVSVSAEAAIPNNTVIIGDKAFAISYLMVPENINEINQAAADAGIVPFYYQLDGMNEVFTDVFTGEPASALALQSLPEITYKDGSGAITVYARGNGDPVVASGDFEVISIE